jgi:hypothetical protein
MTKRDKEETCLEVYKQAVANLDTSHFGVECRHFFLHSFKKRRSQWERLLFGDTTKSRAPKCVAP